MSSRPTVVMVHGAFADGGSFGPVTSALLDDGVQVVVAAGPNRGLVTDAAYIASVVRRIDGPVLLVAHSYGGAVITVAGVEENVVGLVYLAGYALDQGETIAELQGRFPDSPLVEALVFAPFALDGTGEAGIDVSVDVARFPEIFAPDVDPAVSRLLAVSQRPLAQVAFGEPAGVAAWKSKPAWGVVSSSDHVINPDVIRFGYERAHMKVTEVDSSHLVMFAHPAEVVGVIREALATTTS
ncbi:alpha/beta fold hydrolase [Cellulomonas alba]|uniref:Alpha/beta hydrolase n=1 Tax=Cellulomonas alba TaxID=3053467 RepID=A0ABT7SEJ7_9CELL|nr:alpha/beta hydrolase [Cellulomonas alba]MDM7854551.1 alpha/beta hydrolase [Cellulomonas alba]